MGWLMQERGVFKAKWQELLSKHTSAHSATERLQKDLQQLQASYANLQRVNHALERRFLGHHSPTAGHQPASNPVFSSSARQPYTSPPRADANRAGQTGREAGGSPWGSTSDLDRVLAEHRGRTSPGHGQAFEHSEVTLGTEEAELDAETQLAGCVSSKDIMARLTRSPDGASGVSGVSSLPLKGRGGISIVTHSHTRHARTS